jgi:cytochrome c oxidase subunit 2
VDHHITRWVVGAVAVTFLIEAFLLVHNFWTGRQLADFADPDALTIRVTGHQWWWQVEYEDPVPERRVATANEIHIPVGRRVKVELVSSDVIHSFWVPNLQGKTDLIPGYSTTTFLQADSAGVYHGRCAEFCGLQHAHMDFLVIAEPPARFAAWYTGQLRDAAPPANPEAAKGKQVFLANRCAVCHKVRGTEAGGTLGPELTHLASRRTLAAVTLPNTRGHMGGWVVDPQKIKPGVNMPPNPLSPDELRSLLAYLESLK